MTKIIEDLNWRYATKKFGDRKIPDSEIDELLEALRLSPSSFGLQPWKFLVIKDPALREKLKSKAWGQPQITDSSHLIVLCARTDVNEQYVKKFINSVSGMRNIPIEALKDYENIILGSLKRMDGEQIIAWNAKQVYLALGLLLAAAASKRIDACPMEGFDTNAFDEILNLKNLKSVVVCTLGYRSKDDGYAKLAKVRFAKDSVIEVR